MLKRRCQFANRKAQTLRQLHDAKQCYIPLAALDGADVGSMQLRGSGSCESPALWRLALTIWPKCCSGVWCVPVQSIA